MLDLAKRLSSTQDFFLAGMQELERVILETEISQKLLVSAITVFSSPVMTQDTHPLTAPYGSQAAPHGKAHTIG